MIKEELIEALAAIEHQRWADWQGYLHDRCTDHEEWDTRTACNEPTGGLVISKEDKEHWEELINKDYAELSWHSKQADREQVMRYWPVLVQFVTEWMWELTAGDVRNFTNGQQVDLVEAWRRDML